VSDAMKIDTKEIAENVEMPVISLGCDHLKKEKVKETVKNWLALGGRGIDTSLRASFQQVVGQAIKESKIDRKDLFLTTKVPNCSFRKIDGWFKQDLKHLKTDYVDLLLIQDPHGGNCVKAWPEIEKIFDAKQARAIGVSNFEKEDLEPLLKIAKIIPAMNQLNVSIFETHSETIDFMTEKGILMGSHSPLGYGHDESQDLTIISEEKLIKNIAKHYKVSTFQVVMKWMLQHGWFLTLPTIPNKVKLSDADMSGFTLNPKQMKNLHDLSIQSDSSPTSQAGSSSGKKKIVMKTKEIAPNVEMPVISIGCDNLKSYEVKESVKRWLELGGRGIDTSFTDGFQNNVDKVIKESKIERKDLFLTTKVPNCDHEMIAKRVKKDLNMLETDYVDLLLIHHPSRGDCSLAWAELEKVFDAKQARAIGVSNFGIKDLKPLLKNAKIVPHVNQLKLNVLNTHSDTVHFMKRKGIMVYSYSPLGYDEEQDVTMISDIPLMQRVADSHNATTYQVAMKWVLQHGWVASFEATTMEVEASDADVSEFTLTHNEMDELDGLSKFQTSQTSLQSSNAFNAKEISSSSDLTLVDVAIGVGSFLILSLVTVLIMKCRSSRKGSYSGDFQRNIEITDMDSIMYKDERGHTDEPVEEGIGNDRVYTDRPVDEGIGYEDDNDKLSTEIS